MKNLVWTMIFVLTGPLWSVAQKNSLVVLKNGSSIRGNVTQNDTTGVTVITKDGSTWKFAPDEIVAVDEFSFNVNDQGYYNRTSIGVMGGDNIGASLRVVNGFSFNSKWETGIGIGLESFAWNGYIPIFAEGRYSFGKGNTRPMISTHAGYLMPMRNFDFNKGGFTTGLDFGVTHYFTSHLGISTSLGYRFARVKEVSWSWEDFEIVSLMNRFEIRLGLVFR